MIFSEWGELGGSGSIVSNAEDMLKWLKFQVNQGRDEFGKEVVSQEVVYLMLRMIEHQSNDKMICLFVIACFILYFCLFYSKE